MYALIALKPAHAYIVLGAQRIDENQAHLLDSSKVKFKKEDGHGGWDFYIRKDNKIFNNRKKVSNLFCSLVIIFYFIVTRLSMSFLCRRNLETYRRL